jgi:hypothetical protein
MEAGMFGTPSSTSVKGGLSHPVWHTPDWIRVEIRATTPQNLLIETLITEESAAFERVQVVITPVNGLYSCRRGALMDNDRK